MAGNSHDDPHVHINQDIFISDIVVFRNPEIIEAMIVQIVMVICAFLILLGIIYVLCLLIVMGIHHYFFDHDPRHVPDYVKQSVQFSTDEEDLMMSDDEYSEWELAETLKLQRLSSGSIKRESFGAKKDKESSSSSDEQQGPSNSQKVVLLQKFMSGTGQ